MHLDFEKRKVLSHRPLVLKTQRIYSLSRLLMLSDVMHIFCWGGHQRQSWTIMKWKKEKKRKSLWLS